MTVSVDLESRRMALRGVVHVAGEVIAQYWPMHTFTHHNPLHGLEHLPFEEAVRQGRKLLGGQGYLSGACYRDYLRSGRIQLAHLDLALRAFTRPEYVTVGNCRIAHADTLRACLLHGLCEPQEEPQDTLRPNGSNADLTDVMADHLSAALSAASVSERAAAAAIEGRAALGRFLNLSDWCDRVLGTSIKSAVDQELIRWCEAFLDEGHATWPMPGRDKGFYLAWKTLASHQWSPCGIADSRRKLATLPDHAEDAVLESLDILAIPEELRQDYLAFQLTTLPGWAGFIKWRAEQRDYAWQKAHPISLVKFLAVRLWYVRERVGQACKDTLGIEGNFGAISAFMRDRPYEHFLRKESVAGRLPDTFAERVGRGAIASEEGWKALANRLQLEIGPRKDRALCLSGARRLLSLAEALDIAPTVLLQGAPEDLATLIRWMDAFPASDHGPVWLEAFEAGYHQQVFDLLDRSELEARVADCPTDAPVRPQAQSIYCIDVRCEPFRRHLESTGNHETFAFAGFFAAFIRSYALGKEHYTEQFPAVMRARNEVREIPRRNLDTAVPTLRSRANLLHAGHTLLHDLKENVITPYVMVESLGWFYALPLIGKTLWPVLHRSFSSWLQDRLVPPVATRQTVDKLLAADVDERLAAEQCAIVWNALRDRVGVRSILITPEFVEALRLHTMNNASPVDLSLLRGAAILGLTPEALATLVSTLRRDFHINERSASRQRERLTRTGFTLEEQVLTVETVLRMMGLTRNFARIVLFCAHGSSCENNPYESALDCGACGGNAGKPNARAAAMMANNPKCRDELAKRGIAIPSDTHFLAGQLDTTTAQVQLFDLEDLPPTHHGDVTRLREDLHEATQLTSQEQVGRLPETAGGRLPAQPWRHILRRSVDWSQVRPEWGLSGNTAFVIGPRVLTKGLNLAGRVFLHSYDWRQDPTGRSLEAILTGGQLVCHWISMEHYFSTVDNEVYGSSSKVYHNVIGRLGVMSGPWSDLRLGLARQTVMTGQRPYHEPMRLLTVIEAPRASISELIARHELLKHYYHNDWVHLVARDPDDGGLYRYQKAAGWNRIPGKSGRQVENWGKESIT